MSIGFNKRKLNIFIITIAILILFLSSVTTAYAGTKAGKPFFGNDGRWWRYITSSQQKWTTYKYVSGQPSKGTYLKKGNFLFYQSSGGSNVSVSFSVGYGVGSIGISVPLGKPAKSGVGTGLRAPSNGYYKIKVKKLVQISVKTSQACGSKNRKPNGKWKNQYTKKSYKTVRVYPTLVKQK